MGNHAHHALADSSRKSAMLARAAELFPYPELPRDPDAINMIWFLWECFKIRGRRWDEIWNLAKGPPPCHWCGLQHWEGRCECRRRPYFPNPPSRQKSKMRNDCRLVKNDCFDSDCRMSLQKNDSRSEECQNAA